MSYDIVTFGEAMIRLSPPHFQRLEEATSLDVHAGGAELNVAVGASRLGLKSAWISRLPNNPLGRAILACARREGVDLSHVKLTAEGRAGIYFLEAGAAPRASSVVYDRAGSAFAEFQPQEADWRAIFSRTRIFHTSGIATAISPSTRASVMRAIEYAKKAGCIVSYDLNYRTKLWDVEEARKAQGPFMHSIDILFTTEEDAAKVFAIRGKDPAKTAKSISSRFGIRTVAITLRETPGVWRNRWSAIALDKDKVYEESPYEVEVVDRVGAGDAFVAGFLRGIIAGNCQKGLQYGLAFSAIKHSIPGDFCLSSLEEVENLIQGKGLRIQR